jgi:hypothetical protein
MDTLKDSLKDWADFDVAAFYLARSLGLMGQDAIFQTNAKHVFLD